MKQVTSAFHPSRHTPGVTGGFTLLEVVLVLSIITILVAATVPSFRGLKDEQTAREPVTALARMAKETRLRAMQEKRPYQIAFTLQGFTATRYLSPYLQVAELEEFFVQADDHEGTLRQIEAGLSAEALAQAEDSGHVVHREWTSRYLLPSGTSYQVQFWHEATPTPLSGDALKLWVFQPSGMASPLTVRFFRESASFEASFSALTADIVREKSELR